MKLGKLILPVILAVGAIGGFALAGGHQESFKTKAMDDYTNDPSIDVGINVKASATAAADWTICTFYVDALTSGDVSGGDYLAFRMRSNNSGASYFDFFPNVNGTAYRVPVSPAASGIKCIPAVPDGVAFDYGGARTLDLTMNFWADADVWFCIPKSTFSRKHFGGEAIDWSQGLWCVYFMFYGTTIDYVDFDIGDIYTANIDGAGHLVKVNQILNWANGTANIAVVENADKISITYNNENLRPAVKFIQAIDGVDTCSNSAALTAYNANKDAYAALNAANKEYLEDAIMGDYADGDTGHDGGKTIQWTAAQKWEQICKAAGVNASRPILFNDDKNRGILIASIAIAMSALSAFGLFFIIRRRKFSK